MTRLLLLLVLLVVADPALPADAADAAAPLKPVEQPALADPQPTSTPAAPALAGEGVALEFWNREIVVFRGALFGASPEERARRARQRFDELPASTAGASVQVRPVSLGNVSGAVVTSGDKLLFAVLPEDADRLHGETHAQLAERAAQRVREVLDARVAQRRPAEMLYRAALSIVATLVLLAAFWAVAVTRRVLLAAIGRLHERHLQPIWGPEVGRHVLGLELGLVRLLSWVVGLVLTYGWLGFVLTQFPYTAPWGQQLGSYLTVLLSQLALGVLHALPGLFTALLILLAARYLVRVLTAFTSSVERGRIHVAWLQPETVEATRRVFSVLIWLFAITVAYPYIPGSNSAAFKGVSVFAGLMLTIGSAGFIGHLMAGLLVVYARALRKGEMVKVGDTFGVVTEVGALSTKVTTPSLEQVTIPNALLMSSTVVNYSRLAGNGGAILSTKVTIGYDTPWRQVQGLLLLAADRTPSVRKDPKPYVLQTALSDFYVEYELRVYLNGPENRFTILSDLNAQILDAFNEFGVQIMSPHFMMQPDGTVVVRRDDWFAAPAHKDGQSHAASLPGATSS